MRSEIHINLYDSKSKRVIILNSAKSLTKQLQMNAKLDLLREVKMEKIKQVKIILKDVRRLMNNLGIADVPDVQLAREERPKPVKSLKPRIQVEEKEKPIFTYEDRLNAELEEIERRLASFR